MNESDRQLHRAVMRRVWAVYFVRYALSTGGFKVVVFLSCCVVSVFLVSVPNIVQNMSQLPGLVDGAAYLMGAFLNTSVIVEGALVLAVAAGSWLVWDIGRNVSSASRSFFVRGRSRA